MRNLNYQLVISQLVISSLVHYLPIVVSQLVISSLVSWSKPKFKITLVLWFQNSNSTFKNQNPPVLPLVFCTIGS